MQSERKLGSIIITGLFVFLIIISFLLVDSGGMRSTPDTVAKVGDHIIKLRDYNQEVRRQIAFYKQFMGGKELTAQQIQQFRLKENALNNLISRSLNLILADEIGIYAAHEDIVERIKGQEYFLSNKKFDINLYKNTLKQNGYTPEGYEELISKEIIGQKVQLFFDHFSISNDLANEIQKYRDQKLSATLVKIERAKLRDQIPVTNSEIKTYLKEDKNKEWVQKVFNQRKSSLRQPEEILASHILLKTDGTNDTEMLKKAEEIAKKATPKNFASLANTHSQDSNMDPATKKKKGGDLGWFGRGKMVPSFEKTAFSLNKNEISKPIKSRFGYHIIHVRDKKEAKEANYKDHEMEIAREQVRNEKSKQLDQFLKKVSQEVKSNLGSSASLKKITDKYSLEIEENVEINRLDGHRGKIFLNQKNVSQVFGDFKSNKFITTIQDPSQTILISTSEFVQTKPAPKKGEKEQPEPTEEEKIQKVKRSVARIVSRKLKENILDNLREKVSIYQNTALTNQ